MKGYKISLSLISLDDIDDEFPSEPLLSRALSYQTATEAKGGQQAYQVCLGLRGLVLDAFSSTSAAGDPSSDRLTSIQTFAAFLHQSNYQLCRGRPSLVERDVGYGLIAATILHV